MTLYDTDFHRWIEQQVKALKQRDAARLDWDNLAEEIEGIRRFELSEVTSHFCSLLHARLLWDAHPGEGHEAWRTQISTAHIFLTGYLEYSPCLADAIPTLFARAYAKARERAAKEEGLPLETFPEMSPWTWQELVSDGYWPTDEPKYWD
jgi:hypothetical protein